jgi:hypothetical protein
MFGEQQLNTIEGQIPGFRFKGLELGAFFSGQYGIVTILFFFAGVAMLLYVVYGGIEMMLARGEPKAIQAAKEKITNAIIGMIIVFTAYWVVQIVGQIFGLKGITQTFI